MFDRGKCVAPDRPLAPAFTFFLALVGGAHGFPGNAIRMGYMLSGPLPSLLMDQVEVTESGLFSGVVFEEQRLGGKLVGARNGIVARIGDISRAVFPELIIAELEQPYIRSSPLLRIEAGFDFGDSLHEAEIQTESVGGALDLLDRRSGWELFHRLQDRISRL